MKINITKKEYIKLLDVFYIADWIMHAFYSEDKLETKVYRDLEQKFLSLAKEYGVDDLVEKENDEELYSPTRKFEDESLAMDFIEEFEKESFWDELIDQLSTRDLIEKHGSDAMRLVFEDEKINNEFEDLREKYSSEFEENGVKKLRLI
ncbi:hypothetical protein Desdi_0701 [Desulfitobacterium dichloroeliminans LMG P-21439]|uniref:Uncharacterized protein n=1 Tax=Desulfitobacterium dichloroeliminans (strain LMG P-21439 / DCA1) TaxID=871963 RepID=L0F5K4_DESDL|nr:hypothetical protein [Desulfitobacterium dichloroeliminans]AGA68228.1 hypothetical protein Desdi_0701 [Desulfitobacterium dichloroeliminans LMG P-21439]